MKGNRDKISLLMANNCMNTAELEEATKMPRPTVNNVLAGKNVRPKTLGRVAKALNVKVEDILEIEMEVR